jgi:hypothetical protein
MDVTRAAAEEWIADGDIRICVGRQEEPAYSAAAPALAIDSHEHLFELFFVLVMLLVALGFCFLLFPGFTIGTSILLFGGGRGWIVVFGFVGGGKG